MKKLIRIGLMSFGTLLNSSNPKRLIASFGRKNLGSKQKCNTIQPNDTAKIMRCTHISKRNIKNKIPKCMGMMSKTATSAGTNLNNFKFCANEKNIKDF